MVLLIVKQGQFNRCIDNGMQMIQKSPTVSQLPRKRKSQQVMDYDDQTTDQEKVQQEDNKEYGPQSAPNRTKDSVKRKSRSQENKGLNSRRTSEKCRDTSNKKGERKDDDDQYSAGSSPVRIKLSVRRGKKTSENERSSARKMSGKHRNASNKRILKRKFIVTESDEDEEDEGEGYIVGSSPSIKIRRALESKESNGKRTLEKPQGILSKQSSLECEILEDKYKDAANDDDYDYHNEDKQQDGEYSVVSSSSVKKRIKRKGSNGTRELENPHSASSKKGHLQHEFGLNQCKNAASDEEEENMMHKSASRAKGLFNRRLAQETGFCSGKRNSKKHHGALNKKRILNEENSVSEWEEDDDEEDGKKSWRSSSMGTKASFIGKIESSHGKRISKRHCSAVNKNGIREYGGGKNAIEIMWNLLTSTNHARIKSERLTPVLEAPLMRLCARYLLQEKKRGKALDSVANFHLQNGAMVGRLNWMADRSEKGILQSGGIMVNYIYRLETIEENVQSYFSTGHIHASCDVRRFVEPVKEHEVTSVTAEGD